ARRSDRTDSRGDAALRTRPAARRTLGRDPNRQRRESVYEGRPDPLRRSDDFDDGEAGEDLFPEDAQLHLRQPVADAPMDPEAEGQMLPGARSIDDEAIGVLDGITVPIAR